MLKNKPAILVILLILIALFGYLYMSNQAPKASYQAQQSLGITPLVATGQGRAVMTIKDAATSLANVTSIMMTVDKIEVQNASQAWIMVSSASKIYDLVQLKQSGVSMLLADVHLAAGTYNQIRLQVSNVKVTAGGKTTEAKLPSNTLKIAGKFTVVAGQVSTVSLDFIADKSLHVTGNGTYILAPVVRLQTKTDAVVEVKEDESVEEKSGKPETDEDFGMDEKGELKVNFELKEKLEVDDEDRILVSGNVVKSTDDEDEAEDDEDADEKNSSLPILLNFVAQNNSGLSGTVSLTKVDGKVKVSLKTIGGVASLLSPSEPAHIHTGTCANIGAVKYPLSNVIAGRSETVIDVSMDALKAGLPLAINVHKSAAEIGTYIACVDVKF